ncbi:MAG: helix-turn-helix transcriptional regulator [Rhizobiales bacterium]|nr:helix-turn-helix transcriptional regulator [Hyphomicrobiales bacterium]
MTGDPEYIPEGRRERDSTVGQRLRELRKERGLSIAVLAKASGVPGSTISKIENGQLNPSLVHAINLASALDANLGFLVRPQDAHADFVVHRKVLRDAIRYPELALELQDLSCDSSRGILEARIGRIGPGAHSGKEGMRHKGEELCHVLEGRLRYELQDETIVLEKGGTLHFKCDRPHRWVNEAEGETTVLWVFSDGLSF